jgi:hypothetical protein
MGREVPAEGEQTIIYGPTPARMDSPTALKIANARCGSMTSHTSRAGKSEKEVSGKGAGAAHGMV